MYSLVRLVEWWQLSNHVRDLRDARHIQWTKKRIFWWYDPTEYFYTLFFVFVFILFAILQILGGERKKSPLLFFSLYRVVCKIAKNYTPFRAHNCHIFWPECVVVFFPFNSLFLRLPKITHVQNTLRWFFVCKLYSTRYEFSLFLSIIVFSSSLGFLSLRNSKCPANFIRLVEKTVSMCEYVFVPCRSSEQPTTNKKISGW